VRLSGGLRNEGEVQKAKERFSALSTGDTLLRDPSISKLNR